MDTLYGVRGSIEPPLAKDQELRQGDFAIAISGAGSVLEIGFDDPSRASEGRKIGQRLIDAYNLRCGSRHDVNFDSGWEHKPGCPRKQSVELSSTLRFQGRLEVALYDNSGRLVSSFDSEDLSNDQSLAEKMERSATLGLAVRYFMSEAVDVTNPLPGAYRALEELTMSLPGKDRHEREQLLASFASMGRRYVDDLRITCQAGRHDSSSASKRRLTDQECVDRIRVLIQAYADKFVP